MVDDDVALLRVVREALTSHLRCEVDTSPRPEYGFELAIKKSYDLFIFDFQMPMIDGAMLFFLIGKVYNYMHPRGLSRRSCSFRGEATNSGPRNCYENPECAAWWPSHSRSTGSWTRQRNVFREWNHSLEKPIGRGLAGSYARACASARSCRFASGRNPSWRRQAEPAGVAFRK